ncbi:MAG: ABC transporter permease [Bdellovibrionales bacterium]
MNSSIDLRWAPFLTVLEREIRRFLKVIVQTLLTPMINAVLYLMIFGVSLGNHIDIGHGVSYLSFLIPGLIMMGCLNNAFQNSSSSIITAKFGGDLEDFRVSPLTHAQIVWAMSVGGVIRGLAVGFLTFVTGAVFLRVVEGQWPQIAHPFVLATFLILGGLAFAKMGIFIAFWARTFDQLSAVTGFLLLPLIYLGGVFFSLQGLHPWWQKVAVLNPLLYLINGVRYGFLGVSDVPVEASMGVAVATVLIFHVLALRSLKTGSFLRW